MAIPPNITAATAQEITSVPWSAVVLATDVGDAPGAGHDLWFTFVARPNATIGQFQAFTTDSGPGDFVPQTEILKGPDAANLTSVGFANSGGAPIRYYEQNVGTRIWFHVFFTGTIPSALYVSMVPGPSISVPRGSILIVDSNTNQPSVVANATGVLRHFNMVAGETGNTLKSGVVAVMNLYSPRNITLYDGRNQLREIAVILDSGELLDDFAGIGPLEPSSFFVMSRVADTTSTIWQFSDAGTLMQTWTPVTNLFGAVRSLAIALDGSVAYYAFKDSVFGDSPIAAYDLVNGVDLPDFAAPVAGYAIDDVFVMSDGTLLASYIDVGVGSFVRRYAPDGSILQTYAFGPSPELGHIALALDEPASYWGWFQQRIPDGISTFRRFSIASGSEIESFQLPHVDQGLGAHSFTELAPFGVDTSCPLLIVWQEIEAPPGTTGIPSIPCCKPKCCKPKNGKKTPPNATGPILKPVPRVTPLPIMCASGGTVATAPDLTDSEDWSDGLGAGV